MYVRLTVRAGEARRGIGFWEGLKEDMDELYLQGISFVGQVNLIKLDQTKTWRWMHSVADTNPFLPKPSLMNSQHPSSAQSSSHSYQQLSSTNHPLRLCTHSPDPRITLLISLIVAESKSISTRTPPSWNVSLP
jgi:hypothetical protein